MAKTNCRYCFQLIPADAAICPVCGRDLTSNKKITVQHSSAADIAKFPDFSRSPNTISKSKLIALVLAICIALSFVEFGVARYVYNDGVQSAYNNGYEDGSTAGYNTGYDEGYDTGKSEGYDSGYSEGMAVSYDTGYADGQQNGYDSGYDRGKADGKKEGYDSGYEVGKSDGYNSGYSEGKTSAVSSSSSSSSSSESYSDSTVSTGVGEVYVSNSNIYHSYSSCSGMKYYTAMPKSQAEAKGARPCQKKCCYG